ncbi:MAG: hypothetical protein ACJ79H_01970 [Myxococcales bacterium]
MPKGITVLDPDHRNATTQPLGPLPVVDSTPTQPLRPPAAASPAPQPVILPPQSPLILRAGRAERVPLVGPGASLSDPPPAVAPYVPAPDAEYWVVWHYTEAEWAAWLATLQRQARQSLVQTGLFLALYGTLAGGLGLLVFALARPAVPLAAVIWSGWAGLIIVWVWSYSSLVPYFALTQLHGAVARGPRESAIGPWQVRLAGRVWPFPQGGSRQRWAQGGGRHIWVRVTTRQPRLLHFTWIDPWARGRQTTVDIPIPTGQEAVALALAARLKHEVFQTT